MAARIGPVVLGLVLVGAIAAVVEAAPPAGGAAAEVTDVTEVTEATEAWWSGRMAGLVGGIGGAIIGCIGAAIGVLAGTGRARVLVMSLLRLLLVVGVVSLVAGVVALVRSQPYGVYYPLLLIGFLCTVLPVIQIPVIRRRYAALELRHMKAMDA